MYLKKPGIISLLVFIILSLALTQGTAYGSTKQLLTQATSPIPSNIIPTLYCLGSCPTQGQPNVSPATQESSTSSIAPSTSSQPSPSINPCTQMSVHIASNKDKDNDKGENHKKHKKGKNGNLSQFMQQLLQLINLLLQLIGGQTGTPTPTPTPSNTPSGSPQPTNPCPSPSQNSISPTNPSVIPTNKPKNPTPTVFKASPTPTKKPTGPTPTLLPNTSMCSGAATKGKYQHIIWIIFENTQTSTALSKMPYLNQIATQCGVATNFWAETHPSLPNYIAMTSGSTQGITNDSSGMLNVDNIYNQVKQKGLQWRQYAFGMPSNCYLKDNPPAPNAIFTAHHDAAGYYTNIAADCKNWDIPVGSPTKVSDPTDVTNSPLATALDTNTLPAFAIMTPTDDGGNSGVGGEVDPGLGNQFLQRWIPKITSSTAYRSGTVAIFVTWDEPEDFKVIPPKQPVALVVIAPSVKPGTKTGATLTHYSLLKTTEELLGITTFLGHAGDPTTQDLRSTFNL